MKRIEISYLSPVSQPITTPVGVVEKRFKAILRDYLPHGATLELEIQVKGAREKNGNRIVVERLQIDQIGSDSLGITGEVLRKIAVQKLAEECVLAAINFFFPETKPNKKTSLKVPSADDVSRTELIAQTSLSLGLNPPVKEIQEALKRAGVSLEEGTIGNYLTKARKAGLMALPVSSEYMLPHALTGFTPDTLSEEASLIENSFIDAATFGLPLLSPTELLRREKKAKEDEISTAKRKARIAKLKREEDLAIKNKPKSNKTNRKAGQ